MIDLNESREEAVKALGRGMGVSSYQAPCLALIYLGDCIREHESYDSKLGDAVRAVASETGGIAIAVENAAAK